MKRRRSPNKWLPSKNGGVQLRRQSMTTSDAEKIKERIIEQEHEILRAMCSGALAPAQIEAAREYGGLDDVAGRRGQVRRGYRRRAGVPGNGRHQAPQPGLGAGEIRYRPVRLARAARCRRPATTIRQTAGLTLLHVDHPQLTGSRLVIKDLFDRCAAAAGLILLFPLMALLGAMIWLHDGGPALFTQVRVGKDGRVFKIYKFRTMVVNAEQHRAHLMDKNDHDGVLVELRRHPASRRWGRTCGAGRLTSYRN